MTDVLTIGALVATDYLYGDSLTIEQAAGEFAAVCSFLLTDDDSSLTITTRSAVTIVDDSTAPPTTLFAGEVVNVDDEMLDVGHAGRRLRITCRDYNVLVEEAIIDAAEEYSAEADSDIIDDLFSTYRPDIDSTTYVSTVDASMTISFADMTLRQAMDELCGRTGGRWYVDESKNLHYFSSEANVAAWHLSDSPDNATSFPYQSVRRTMDAANLINQILVIGTEIRDSYEDAASVAAYGARPGPPIVDTSIETQAELDARGAAILAKYSEPRYLYDVVFRKEGLRAGMDVRLVVDTWGIDETLTVRRLRLSWRGRSRFYEAELGDGVARAVTVGRGWIDRLNRIDNLVVDLDDTVYDTDPPSTPTFLDANLTTGVDIDADGHQVVWLQATWGAVGDADLDYYQVQISTSNDFSGYTITRNHSGDGDRIERFQPVVGNTQFYARVRAVDWVGNVSPWSTTRSEKTAKDSDAPAQVQGLVAAGSRTLIGLSWTANTEADLKEYEIQRADDVVGMPGAWSTVGTAMMNFYIDQDFTDGEIEDEDTFWYRVRAVDTSNNNGDWSAETSESLSKIVGEMIAAETIIGDHIFANTITADKLDVSELSAISADLGTCTAGTLTGATIRTHDPAVQLDRVQLDSTDGIQCYNSLGVQTVSIRTTGAGWLGTAGSIAWNIAGGMTIDGGLLVDGTIVATALTNTLGHALFSAADGKLLLGPYGVRTETQWKSSRGQVAVISGAYRELQGAWLGTRGVAVLPGGTNLVENPIAQVNVTDFWTFVQAGAGGSASRDTTKSLFGDACFKIVEDDTSSAYLRSDDITVPDGDTAAVSGYIHRWNDHDANILLYDVTNSTTRITLTATALDEWQYLSGTWENTTGGDVTVRVYLRNTNAAGGTAFVRFDGIQVELADAATDIIVGDMGSGYAWTGTEHNSTSTRTATEINLDDAAQLVNNNNTFSIRLVVQMPYDYDDTWPVTTPRLFEISDASRTQRITVSYVPASEYFLVYVNDGSAYNLTTDTVTFNAGDVLDLVFTFDFGADEYHVYMNDTEILDDSTSMSLPASLVEWNLGTQTNGANAGGFVFSEFAMLDTVLSAGDVAALYVVNRPLVDAGALDLPGIYLIDGRFRLASSATGARTEIDVDGIAAYSASAQSVAIDTDGDAKFGSDVSAAGTTALAIFATAQTYNSESVGAGDVLFGDNTASKANMLWDVSDGKLKFRGGTTTQVFINTDGSLQAGGGAIKISSAANILFSVASANQGLAWFSDSGFSTGAGYIRVETAGDNDMRIVTGDTAVAGYSDFYLQTESSDGTKTPLAVDAADSLVGIYQSSPAGTLHVRQNDGTAAIPVLILEQDDADAPYIRFVDGTLYSGKSGQDEYVKVQIGGADRFLQLFN